LQVFISLKHGLIRSDIMTRIREYYSVLFEIWQRLHWMIRSKAARRSEPMFSFCNLRTFFLLYGFSFVVVHGAMAEFVCSRCPDTWITGKELGFWTRFIVRPVYSFVPSPGQRMAALVYLRLWILRWLQSIVKWTAPAQASSNRYFC